MITDQLKTALDNAEKLSIKHQDMLVAGRTIEYIPEKSLEELFRREVG